MTKLVASNLSAAYGDRFVFKSLSLQLQKGDGLFIDGTNGSGKSTLLQILGGLRRPLSGHLILDDKLKVVPASPRVTAEYRKEVGFLGHDRYLYRDLSIRENLRLFSVGSHSKLDFRVENYEEFLTGFNLVPFIDRRLADCSFGVQKKADILRAILHSPQILILDEPFSGLDKDSASFLIEFLKRFKAEGKSLVFSSHEKEIVRELISFEFNLGQEGRDKV